jgi:uncharacterized repeat protein (TIGR02543 family)
VDGYGGDSGNAILDYHLEPLPIYFVDVSSTMGGVVQPGSGHYASNMLAGFTATPNPGFTFTGWSGSFNSTGNPININVTNPVSLVAQFAAEIFADDFESGGFNTGLLNWDLSVDAGNVPWFVTSDQSSGGTYSARSGLIGHSQSSKLRLSFTTPGGMASFDVRVSSEPNWDFLRFYRNGALSAQWSGEVGWLTHQVAVGAGTNTFEWRYVKDASGIGGLDAAFIDNLKLPLAVPSIVLTNVSWGAFDVIFTGQPGQPFFIQASTNATHWETIATNQAAGGLIPFTDPQAAQHATRYYRAMVPWP